MRWSRFSNLSDRRLVLAVTLAGGLACLLASCTMPELTRVSAQRFPEPDACAHCHVEIYQEWAHSPHARAFVNDRFRQATDDHQFQQCLGCHAPQPMLTTTEPQPRASQRELGVACVSCHLDDGAMVGPLPPTGMAKPHPIKVDPSPFDNGRLCGRCHQGTLAQWQSATISNKQDCRHCHMPQVNRKMTQATSLISKPIVAAEKPTLEHRHTFSLVPEDLPDPPFELQVTSTRTEATITLQNYLPHNLPTGDFGVRIVQIQADGIDANGNTRSLEQWELTSSGNGSLPSGQSRQWSLALPSDTKTLRIIVARHGRDDVDRIVLLRKEVACP